MTSDPHAGGRVLYAGAALDTASLAVVLLHGRGGSAEDILQLASAFGLADVAYLAPEAAGGTWYPFSFLAPRDANEPHLSSALARVESVVRSIEAVGIERPRIAVGGFSQGACLAAEFVAGHPQKYAGLIGFTGGLIGEPGAVLTGSREGSSALGGMPALLCSGDPDPHVPWSRVEESAAVLRGMGAVVTAKRYPGRGHMITQEELRLAREMLAAAAQDRGKA